ncbi:MAG: hypothetical protein M3R45_08945 [Pseudomonadota bacterium]|nr:hypothetical protein [Pseudomonadota bacterium]
MIKNLMDGINTLRAKCVLQSSRYRAALDDVPGTLFGYWRDTAKREFPGIPCDAVFFARATVGLMNFFDCVAKSQKPCGLPSKAADSVWHAWLECDPAGLERFCRKHFRRQIPHIKIEDMGVAKDDSLANCLVMARRLEGIKAVSVDLPALFRLDARLKMSRGYGYRTCNGKVGFAGMDRKGIAGSRLSYPDALLPASLLAAGLVSSREYEAYIASLSVNRSSSGDRSSGGSDGGDGGGCSCGSSCGGGCGGD